MTERYRAGSTRLGDLGDEVLAVCPSCGGCVRIVSFGDARRGACPSCAWTREARQPTHSRPLHDHYLGLPLWLQTPVAGETLWAYNAEHLDVLAAYVGAGLRERGDYDRRLPRPMVDKLPRWIKEAKHRDEVLTGIGRLRARLAEA